MGFIPLLKEGHNYGGLGIPLAATVLAIMILPTIVALSREAMRGSTCRIAGRFGCTRGNTMGDYPSPRITHVYVGDNYWRNHGHYACYGRDNGDCDADRKCVEHPDFVPQSGEPLTAKILLDIDNFIIDPDARSALFALGAILLVMEIGFIVAIHIISNQMKKQMEGAT